MRLTRILACALAVFPASVLRAQPFDVSEYEAFLARTEAVSFTELRGEYPSGVFAREISGSFDEALYADTVSTFYGLTGYERSLLDQHGFVVTERYSPPSFGEALYEVYREDLPVYISSDALLHAWHMSYDAILREIEGTVLAGELEQLLLSTRAALPDYVDSLADDPRIEQAADDIDVYLTVAYGLLTGDLTPLHSDNQALVDEIAARVAALQPAQHKLFAETCRVVDYSQFKPRGHYTQTERLKRYFRAMMWLGRIELYLIAPETAVCRPTYADVRRQTLMSIILAGLTNDPESKLVYDRIERTLAEFVGEQDNIDLSLISSLASDAGIETADAFLDDENAARFYQRLSESPLSRQRINSQILYTNDVRDVDKVEPAAAFMLFGQRFVVDSYVTGHVVYSEVEKRRMLPSTADVLFALGNDAALNLLESDIEQYEYGPQLAALRYLIDGYEDAFWSSTLYNSWLQAVRTLNPPPDRSSRPAFARTAAWTQKQMTTQLAGWAQLRHDNLLYAKQSYSGGVGCYYPYVLVEPVPDFFAAMGDIAERGHAMVDRLAAVLNPSMVDWLNRYFDELAGVSQMLFEMSSRQVDGLPLTEEQMTFAQSMIIEGGGSGQRFDGWYPRLFFHDKDDVFAADMVVADVHTAPTDAAGNPVGWVVHAGTGPVNLAVIRANVPGVGEVAFAGPVMSYYEHVSTNYERLTDEDWETMYAMAPSVRPDFANLYLASVDGSSRGTGFVLPTSTTDVPRFDQPGLFAVSSYPNPFTERTTIVYTIDRQSANNDVQIEIFDIAGRLVESIELGPAPAGNYSWRWDPGSLSSGTYVARVRSGGGSGRTMLTFVR